MTQMNIRIDRTLLTEAKVFCLERDILLGDMVQMAIANYIEKPKKNISTKDKKKDNLID